jgi:hypothetical protein
MNFSDNNFSGLIKQLRDDTTTLVKEEVALAKTELSEAAGRLSLHALVIAAGALVAQVALILLLAAMAVLVAGMLRSMGWSTDMATFLGLLAVALLSGIVGSVLVLGGLKAFKAESLMPRKTIQSLKEDQTLIKNNLP